MAEKPDIIAGKILEGRVAIICDGSPTVLTLPFVLFEHFQSSEDYYIKSYRATIESAVPTYLGIRTLASLRISNTKSNTIISIVGVSGTPCKLFIITTKSFKGNIWY